MDKLLRNKKAIILFVAPAFILFTVVLLIPICKAIYYSFCNYKLPGNAKFLGFEGMKWLNNYKQLLLKDKTLMIAL
jgi:raffinose/stachyose/melibiose transport system permease protein